MAVFALALVIRLGLVVVWLGDDYRAFESGDYVLYRVGAEHIRDNGDFSNSLFLVRPPAFPLVVLALGVNPLAVLLVDALLGALLAPGALVLARRLGLPLNAATVAGVIVAVDPGSVVHSAFLGPEPLANLTLLGAVLALLRAVDADGRHGWTYGLAAGGLLALSVLARPATYLLWLPLGGWLLWQQRGAWRAVLAFGLVAVVGAGAWALHNRAVFGNFTVSTVSAFTLLYYRAAAVERTATGEDIDTVFTNINRRVEQRLGRDGANVDAGTRFGYLAASPQVTDALNAVSLEIIRAHPLVYVATFPVGFARMFGFLPSQSRLPGALVYVEVLWNVALVAGTAVGLWLAGRQKRWRLFWCVLLLCAYYTAGTLMVKSAGMNTRERSMLAPFMATACAVVVQNTNRKERQAREEAKKREVA
jgi:hypothetical protein